MYACMCKHDSVYTVRSIELKFHMYITGHRWTNPIDFGEYRKNNFLHGYKKELLYITAYEVKFLNVF